MYTCITTPPYLAVYTNTVVVILPLGGFELHSDIQAQTRHQTAVLQEQDGMYIHVWQLSS